VRNCSSLPGESLLETCGVCGTSDTETDHTSTGLQLVVEKDFFSANAAFAPIDAGT